MDEKKRRKIERIILKEFKEQDFDVELTTRLGTDILVDSIDMTEISIHINEKMEREFPNPEINWLLPDLNELKKDATIEDMVEYYVQMAEK